MPRRLRSQPRQQRDLRRKPRAIALVPPPTAYDRRVPHHHGRRPRATCSATGRRSRSRRIAVQPPIGVGVGTFSAVATIDFELQAGHTEGGGGIRRLRRRGRSMLQSRKSSPALLNTCFGEAGGRGGRRASGEADPITGMPGGARRVGSHSLTRMRRRAFSSPVVRMAPAQGHRESVRVDSWKRGNTRARRASAAGPGVARISVGRVSDVAAACRSSRRCDA